MNGRTLNTWTVDEWLTRMCTNLQLEMSGVATDYEPYEAIATKDIILTNGRRTVCPTIFCTGAAAIDAVGAEFNIGEGTHKILDLQLKEGETPVTVSGTGAITFVYQEGDL